MPFIKVDAILKKFKKQFIVYDENVYANGKFTLMKSVLLHGSLQK